jgi:proteasome lid subunit RPN8/RPN11
MYQIKISRQNLDKIREHGERDYPHECCGFLLGETDGQTKTVVKCEPVQNSRESNNRHNRYFIRPEDYMRVEQLARREHLDIVGFYHSHPNAEAKPSQYDLDHSWPFYSYIIVSVKNKKAEKWTSWQLKDDRSTFLEERLIAVEDEYIGHKTA